MNKEKYQFSSLAMSRYLTDKNTENIANSVNAKNKSKDANNFITIGAEQ